jgi:hypothetical protein
MLLNKLVISFSVLLSSDLHNTLFILSFLYLILLFYSKVSEIPLFWSLNILLCQFVVLFPILKIPLGLLLPLRILLYAL